MPEVRTAHFAQVGTYREVGDALWGRSLAVVRERYGIIKRLSRRFALDYKHAIVDELERVLRELEELAGFARRTVRALVRSFCRRRSEDMAEPDALFFSATRRYASRIKVRS